MYAWKHLAVRTYYVCQCTSWILINKNKPIRWLFLSLRTRYFYRLFLGFSNFCRYYTRSQTGKSTGYQLTLKSLIFIWVISLTTDKIIMLPSEFNKSNGKDNKSEYNFLLICRYLNLVKNQDNFLANTNYNIKFWTNYGEKYMLFSLKLARKVTLLSPLKGNKYSKMYNFKLGSQKWEKLIYCIGHSNNLLT